MIGSSQGLLAGEYHCVLRGGYVRYCDDFVILGDSKAELVAARCEVTRFLNGLRLKLHENRAVVRSCRRGVTFVGFRLWPTHRYLRKENIRAFRRRLRWMTREYKAGRLAPGLAKQRIAAWLGHAVNANSDGLIEKLLPQFEVFADKDKQVLY